MSLRGVGKSLRAMELEDAAVRGPSCGGAVVSRKQHEADRAAVRRRPEHLLRARTEDDNRQIFSAWIKGTLEAPGNHHLPAALFVPIIERHIRRCLARAETFIACHLEAPDEIIAFVCLERTSLPAPYVVHWVYVKNMWRGLGVADAMLSELVPRWRSRMALGTGRSRHSAWIERRGGAVYCPHAVGIGETP
jgi:hypothetical protein